MNNSTPRHRPDYPTARKIRRACEKELYRTLKRLDVWVPKERVEQAEKLYFEKVALNLPWIHEHTGNRKALCDWWDENVSEAVAELWEVDPERLRAAFRSAFGG